MRRILALSFAGMVAAAGCRMCASPYDYCGPVVDDCCCGSEYQPQVTYQGTPTPAPAVESIPAPPIEQPSEPIYYEGAKPLPPQVYGERQSINPFNSGTTLPRQAKRRGLLDRF